MEEAEEHWVSFTFVLYDIHHKFRRSVMLSLKVTTVGSSAGFILPKEAMAFLKIQKGDTVFLTEAADGSYRLTPFNPDFERQMSLAEAVMHEDRDLLRALSK